MQCGKHGYSARDYGFRFDIEVDAGDMGAAGAGAGAGGRTDSKGASEKGASDGHVYGSKAEKVKIRVNEKEITKAEIKEKVINKEEDKELTDISASLEAVAIEIEIPCDDQMRECLFVPIPIPIHPHAGDPLLVEDPGRAGILYPLFPCLCLYLCIFLLLSHFLSV